jgi:hypothetical protein
MRPVTILSVLVLASCIMPVPSAAQVPADSEIVAARRAFDFLIGRWEVQTVEDTAGVRPSRGQSYEFAQDLAGALITSRWHFDRGTPERPDVVDAAYYQAFDNTARIWTFYYVSPQSAQYWPGHLENGRWYFTNTFTRDGATWRQRQWWEPVGRDTLRRHIENSVDGGKTWIPYVVTLRRVPGR